MDIRPLLYFWLNKPDTLDTWEDHMTCAMAYQTYHQIRTMDSMSGQEPMYRIGTIRWGDPNSLLDLWIDIDKAISNCTSHENLCLESYLRECLLISEDDWELWPEADVYLQDIFDAL